jgi:hypothetical protein
MGYGTCDMRGRKGKIKDRAGQGKAERSGHIPLCARQITVLYCVGHWLLLLVCLSSRRPPGDKTRIKEQTTGAA